MSILHYSQFIKRIFSLEQDLRAINNMLKLGEKKQLTGSKRIPLEEDPSDSPSAKRYCGSDSPHIMRGIDTFIKDRQLEEANGSR